MSVREVNPREAVELLDRGALLLDVREPDEWEAGHAPMARATPLAEVPDHLEDLPRDRTILCVCRSGARSKRAATFLAENGFDAVNVTGGMQAWFADELPVVSDQGEPRID